MLSISNLFIENRQHTRSGQQLPLFENYYFAKSILLSNKLLQNVFEQKGNKGSFFKYENVTQGSEVILKVLLEVLLRFK